MSSKAIGSFQDKIMETLRQMQAETQQMSKGQKDPAATDGGPSFVDHLKDNLHEINHSQIKADRMSMELSTGKTNNIHETMLATSQAELSFNLMVQVRNKALEAYNEIMRMPV
jgi:flagellar hook-basal body complex protein FliE